MFRFAKVVSLALLAAFILAVPVFANAFSDKISFLDKIVGLHLVKTENSPKEIEKEYTFTKPVDTYEAVLKAVKRNGWRIVAQELDNDCGGCSDLKAVKDGYTLSIDFDEDDGVYTMEVELKNY